MCLIVISHTLLAIKIMLLLHFWKKIRSGNRVFYFRKLWS